ncbi:MAG: site-2 protease family protein [Euryarchaeota archaeon]|nr:site-2 protease family protein [Euryarchaeota archaeon]
MAEIVYRMILSHDPAEEVEQLRSAVAKYFPIYDVNVSYRAVTMMVSVDADTMEENFENLRLDLKDNNYIPFIRYEGGEHSISIVRKPPLRKSNIQINRALIAITFLTTTLAGMLLWSDYSGSDGILTLENFLFGAAAFAIPLLFILGTHELSHYYASKKNGVEASLPYFIPFIPPLGTMGAFISLREPMPNRKALVEIGASGPLGGLIATLPIALIGLYLTSQGQPISGPIDEAGAIYIVFQPLYILLGMLFPAIENVAIHPTAFAAWVGFFVTAINLLPAGQLDGGHIAQGLLGDKAKYLSYGTAGLLIILSFVLYTGWLIFALLVILLGLRHPKPLNDISSPGPRAKMMGAATLVVFLLTFVPTPFIFAESDHSFEMNVEESRVNAILDEGAKFYVILENTGNSDSKIELALKNIPPYWGSSIKIDDNDPLGAEATLNLKRDSSVKVTVTLIPRDIGGDGKGVTKEVLLIASYNDHSIEETLYVIIDPANNNGE